MLNLSIIIPTWNTAEITVKCVRSLQKYLKNFPHEIIIVDNASTDNTVAKFKKEKGIVLIQNKKNLGFAKACNIGSKKSKGDYLFFLNSDMIALDSSLIKMYEYLKNNPKIGLIGPKYLNIDRSVQGSVFPPQTPLNALKEFWLGKNAYSKYSPRSKKPIEVHSLSGGAILISKKLFNEVGGWDERYFMYFEDLELCRQIKKLGYKIFYYPQCRFVHRHGASGQKLADSSNQWRRLVPSSKIYHGHLTHYYLFSITWLAQKINKLNIKKILLLAFIIRLFLLPWIYHGDITVTYWWGKFAAEFTWRGYYDWLNFGGYGRPDQPMLNIFYVWLVRLFYLLVHQIIWFINVNIPAFPSKIMSWFFLHGNQVLLKLPMIIADTAIIYFVYSFVSKSLSKTKATFAAIFLALYLPMIYNSALWGSGDSIINLLALLAIYFLYHKKYLLFTFLFLCSILYKFSLAIWSPVILTILIYQRIKLADIIKSVGLSVIFIYLVSFPFATKNPFIWFWETITQKIMPGAMPQITSNAMNFWGVIFGLKPRLDETLVFNLISFRQLSLLICLVFYIYICVKLYKNFSIKNVLLTLVQITLVTFTFMTRMHERYTYPALIPLLLLSLYDRKFFKYFIILSVTHCLNVYNWWWIPKIPFLITLLKSEVTTRIISLIQTLLTISLLSTKLFTSKNE